MAKTPEYGKYKGQLLRIEVINGLELAERFREMGREIQNESDRQVMQAGLLVGGKAKELVHVDTGRCRASISTQLLPKSMATVVTSATGPQVHYGAALEHNYPYMEPALEQKKEEIQKMFGDMVTQIIRRKV